MSNRSRRNLIGAALCLLFSGSVAAPSRALITVGALDLPGARDVEVVEDLAYVVIGSGFNVVDVSNPEEPVTLSTFPTEGLATSAAVVDGLLYLGVSGRDYDEPTTLRAIDVSNPLAPVELGTIELVDRRKGVSDIAVVNGIVYVGGSFGLKIVDASNPVELVEIAALDPAAIGEPMDMAVVADRLYVAFYQISYHGPIETGGLRVIDISNPAIPVVLGSYEYAGYATGVAVAGNLACVTGYVRPYPDPTTPPYNLLIIDVSEPSAPAELARVETPGTAEDVEIANSFAYVADGSGLWILDISDPTLPIDAGGLSMPHDYYLRVWDVVVAGELAYFVNGVDLRVVAISEVAFPTQTGQFDTPGNPADVRVEEQLAYLADGDLRIVDVSNPMAPVELGSLDAGAARLVRPADGLVYIAERGSESSGEGSLRIVDASDPTAPIELTVFPLPGVPTDLEIAGGRAYVTLNLSSQPYGHVRAGLRIIDVSSPTSPSELGSVDFEDGTSWAGVAVTGELAYVANHHSRSRINRYNSTELVALDVTDPAAPFEIGALEHIGGESAGTLEVVDGIAYHAFYRTRGYSALHTVDVSNPAAPVELGRVSTLDGVRDLAFVDGLVYVAANWAGGRAIDVSEPTAPIERGAFAPYGIASGIAMANGLSYVTDAEIGALRIIDFGPEYTQTLEVEVDIKPGSDPNPVNFSVEGVVPVAVLGTDDLDVADVDAATLAFGPSGAAPAHCHGPHLEDVNGDGHLDLLAHFRSDQTGIAFGARTACLAGETRDGTPLRGCDGVRTVPDQDGDGLLDALETTAGTHALNPDSDGDGFGDGDEVLALGTDPLNALDPTPAPAQVRTGRGGKRRR